MKVKRNGKEKVEIHFLIQNSTVSINQKNHSKSSISPSSTNVEVDNRNLILMATKGEGPSLKYKKLESLTSNPSTTKVGTNCWKFWSSKGINCQP